MHDINLIRTEPEIIRQAILDKRTGDVKVVDEVLSKDKDWRETQTLLQQKQSESNDLAKSIGLLMKDGKKDEAQGVIARNGDLKAELRDLEEKSKRLESSRYDLLLHLPNIPHESVPRGVSPEDNVVDFEWGEKRVFDFQGKPHWEIIEYLGLVDFERGAKVTGAGFPFYMDKGAKLQRALINYFLDTAGKRGYVEVQPPIFVNAKSATATGQLPDKEGQMYEMTVDELYAVPTAEVPVTNYLRDEILLEKELPVKYCAYTPCFRREAGSYGKDVRGLNRLHQFDKVELVQYVHPDLSYEAIENLRSDAEYLLQDLGLAYRRLHMCTADMGFTQSKKYDLEVWSSGQQRWLEVSSISNFESFQARRAGIRYRPNNEGKPVFLHTLNGSGLALPRVVAALIENYQEADGSVKIPDALKPYTGFNVLTRE